MISIKNKYLGDLRTESVHLKSGVKIITDAPVDNNGKGESFSPTDLVCSALASCMVTIMGIKARDMNISIEGIEMDVVKIMASEPRRIAEISVHFTLKNHDLTERDKTILENVARTCPVALSLSSEIKQNVSFNW